MTWDTATNVHMVQSTVDYLTKGCKCKTGCGTRRCKCKKDAKMCGPSCRCVNCTNSMQYMIQQQTAEEICDEIQEEIREQEKDGEYEDEEYEDEELSDKEGNSDDDKLDEEVNEIMEEVFGVPF